MVEQEDQLAHSRRASSGAELRALLRDWEVAGCASALSKLFVLFAAGHPWGTEAAEEVLLPRLPATGCLITVTCGVDQLGHDLAEMLFGASWQGVPAGEPMLVRVGPSGRSGDVLAGADAIRPDSADLAGFLGSKSVSAEVAAYRRDGIAVYRDVLPPNLLEECRQHVAWLAKHNPGTRTEWLDMMYGDPFWHRLVSDPRLLDIAAEYVGPDIALFQTHWIAKPPRDGMPVLYHQDGAYWETERGWGGGRDPMITIRVIADDEDESNGCMKVLKGSHTYPLLPKRSEGKGVKEISDRSGAETENVLGTHIDLDIDESDAESIPLNAGDVSVHSSRLVHGSGPNLSARWRRGLTVSYMPASMRVVAPEQRDTAASMGEVPAGQIVYPYLYLLRGDGVPGVNDGSPRNFEWNPRPIFQHGQHMRFDGYEDYLPSKLATRL